MGTKKALSARPNTRSSHWVAPSQSNGCTMSCSYCYVPRRKGYANPITTFVNIEQIMGYLSRHAGRQGKKLLPDAIDPEYWVYEIGENGDCSADAAICDNVKDLIGLYTTLPNAKLTFATKFVNREMLTYDPQRKTLIRFSLMPHEMSKLVDVRTTPISDRIAVMNEFYEAGYEVNVSFAPVIYHEGWLDDWRKLFIEMNEVLSEPIKKQILTLRIDEQSAVFFDAQRKLYFPKKRNFLNAHLTLFHQLEDDLRTYQYLAELQQRSFQLQVTGFINLGAGVAYQMESPELKQLHLALSGYFNNDLIPQDKQPLRPHITIMNKTTPEAASALIAALSQEFKPFTIMATGIDLWTYLGGPWHHISTYKFIKNIV